MQSWTTIISKFSKKLYAFNVNGRLKLFFFNGRILNDTVAWFGLVITQIVNILALLNLTINFCWTYANLSNAGKKEINYTLKYYDFCK